MDGAAVLDEGSNVDAGKYIVASRIYVLDLHSAQLRLSSSSSRRKYRKHTLQRLPSRCRRLLSAYPQRAQMLRPLSHLRPMNGWRTGSHSVRASALPSGPSTRNLRIVLAPLDGGSSRHPSILSDLETARTQARVRAPAARIG